MTTHTTRLIQLGLIAALTGCSAHLTYPATDTGNDAEALDASAGDTSVPDAGPAADASCATPATWYRDQDGDGFGDDAMTVEACVAPTGYSYRGGDCDDNNNSASPRTREICDDVDNDCDTVVDNGLATQSYYRDSDGDNFGETSMRVESCQRPSGYATNDGDCDDSNRNTYPGAPELCDMLDNNCNTTVDDGVLAVAWYVDADGDGYGTDRLASVLSCSPQDGRSQRSGDCNDAVMTTFPGAMEFCDRVDSDCSMGGLVEADEDTDQDGHSPPTAACMGGFAKDDCNDLDPSTHGGIPFDTCGGGDNDCDTRVDEDVMGSGVIHFADADSDSYGDSSTVTETCTLPPGRVTRGGDCNDASASVRPGAPELCNAVDDDCDTLLDNNVTGAPRTDNPVGVCNTNKTCIMGSWQNAYESIPMYEGVETSCDSLDNDCDGQRDEGLQTLRYLDSDRDGYGADPAFTCPMLVMACPAQPGYVDRGGDLADSNAALNPGVSEVCDGVDQNANGAIDEGAICPAGQLCAATTSAGAGSTTITTIGCRPCEPPPATLTSSNIAVGTDLVWCSGTATVDVPASTTVIINGSLTIGAGITMRMGAGSSIRVRNVLRAHGTATSPVVFTGAAATIGSWRTIELAAGSIVMNNTIVEYASAAFTRNGSSMLRSAVADSTVRQNSRWMSNYSGSMDFWRTTFELNNGGNEAYDNLRDCTVRNNAGTAMNEVTLRGGSVSGNGTVTSSSSLAGGSYACRVSFTGNAALGRIHANQCTIADNTSGWSLSTGISVTNSNICRNGATDVRLTSAENVNFANNYWCTTDPTAIGSRIIDQVDNGALGIVTFAPVLTAPSPTAPPIP